MFEDAKAKAHRKRRRRRRGKHRWQRELDAEDEEINDRLEQVDSSLLSEDERAARRRADQKVALAQAALRGALITVLLFVFVPFAGVC